MRTLPPLACLLLFALTLQSADSVGSAPAVVVASVLSTNVTGSGQPIILPRRDVRVVVSTYEIAPGADLPEHKNPYVRYAYVLTGTLRVSNTQTNRSETYKPGDFIVEAIGQWHKARNIGNDTIRLLVIDQVEGNQKNTILRQ